MTPTLSFYGATRTVTGSKHLLSVGKAEVLIDCGLFQGPRAWRDKNWEPFPFDPTKLDAVVLTHAHADHLGMIPKLVKDGFTGEIWSTPETKDLAVHLLEDAAKIMEKF